MSIHGISAPAAAKWVRAEVENISLGCAKGGADEAESWRALLYLPEHRTSRFLCTRIALFQAFSGANVVIFFAGSIFEQCGLGAEASNIAIVATGVANLTGVVVAAWFSDTLGRRPLLIGSFASMSLCALSIALGSVLNISLLMVLGCVLFMFVFNTGAGPLPYLIYSEVFAGRVRAKGAALCGALNWAANILITLTFLPLATSLGTAPTFAIYALVNAVAVAFTWEHMFETKGRSLQEIERALAPTECPVE
mmetsp:Transcript_20068/g.24044  ORF Transcript_20068/g.24044 Transcript_20068/m.24044 type:complete len:252 (-) Transcript_20068:294-1049(-)